MDTKILSPTEYEELLAKKDKEIQNLKAEVELLTMEKEEMIESFAVSSNLLIERMKDLESQRIGYRPQTANVLGEGNSFSRTNFRKKGNSSSQEKSNLKSSNLAYGQWEETKQPEKKYDDLDGFIKEDEDEAEGDEDLYQTKNSKSVKPSKLTSVEPEKNEKVCFNCSKSIPEEDFEVHTILCCRNISKCKVCSERISKEGKMTHLAEWRDPDRILSFIKEKNFDRVDKAFAHGANPNHQFIDQDQRSYLHFAVSMNWLELINLLLNLKVDLDVQDGKGDTSLMIAVQEGYIKPFKLLIDKGANMELRNKISWNALFYVCKAGDPEMLKLLMEHKVDLKATTALGDNCLAIAQKNGKSELTALLAGQGLSLRPTSRSLRKIA